MHEDDGAEEPPGAALPVHVEHPQDLGEDEQVGERKKKAKIAMHGDKISSC